jgi:hypothetical protein
MIYLVEPTVLQARCPFKCLPLCVLCGAKPLYGVPI